MTMAATSPLPTGTKYAVSRSTPSCLSWAVACLWQPKCLSEKSLKWKKAYWYLGSVHLFRSYPFPLLEALYELDIRNSKLCHWSGSNSMHYPADCWLTYSRCGIPVVIMGETGCGKTRLIRYMCDLARQGMNKTNMMILKVHVCMYHALLVVQLMGYSRTSV